MKHVQGSKERDGWVNFKRDGQSDFCRLGHKSFRPRERGRVGRVRISAFSRLGQNFNGSYDKRRSFSSGPFVKDVFSRLAHDLSPKSISNKNPNLQSRKETKPTQKKPKPRIKPKPIF